MDVEENMYKEMLNQVQLNAMGYSELTMDPDLTTDEVEELLKDAERL